MTGIDPARFYNIRAFSDVLKLSENVRACLLQSLRAEGQSPDWIDMTAQQRFVRGQTGIEFLNRISADVRAVVDVENKRKAAKRKRK